MALDYKICTALASGSRDKQILRMQNPDTKPIRTQNTIHLSYYRLRTIWEALCRTGSNYDFAHKRANQIL